MRLTAVLLVTMLISTAACNKDKGGDEGDPGENGGSGGNGGGGGGSGGSPTGSYYGKVVLKGSGAALTAAAANNCGFSLDIYRGEGACFTPVSTSAHVISINLISDVAGRPPARLLAEDEATGGGGKIFSGSEVALDDTGGALVGNNTLWDEYDGKPQWNGVGIDMAYVRTQVNIRDKFVTVLIPGFSQPFPAYAKEICGFDDTVASQDRYASANLLPGLTFQRGDFLFCVKDSADAACAAADYRFLDTSSKTLVEARPSNAKRSSYLAGTPAVCSASEGDRYGFNFKLAQLVATIPEASQFKLYGDFSHGDLSHQNLGDVSVSPYVIYYYEPVSGGTTQGTELVTTLTFDQTDSVFVETLRLTDVASLSLETSLAGLNLKSLWAYDKKFGDGVEGGFASHYAGMTATAAVELSGGSAAPKAKEQL